ncbi:cation:H+ antiporter [Fodinibius salinus]|uniref:Cation:H+ antiporter n=1 Tax=Fodinibius salinus TaxID=860790 RepID=A0A5D3YMA9_9BACT|nr:sodium:calcium antiporter [Fodinibius salinus]TYP94977.1 cation:H+ antiporter [Fodinibius salinus]
MVYSILILFIGLLLVVYFSEKLVESTVGTSMGFGISAFLISVIFIGFDPENLGLGAVASYHDVTGIAIGTIIGSAMVAIALALGITAIIVPLKFDEVPAQIPIVQVGAVILFGILSFDGMVSRIDGALLLAAYGGIVWYLIDLSKRGLDIRAAGEVAEELEEGRGFSRWQALALLVVSLVAILIGSEMIISSSKEIMAGLGISDTVFGITILALLVSIEELARELPAALKGRPDITVGNVVGSVLAFFLFNTGIIALVNPIPISAEVFNFYLPISLAAVLFITSLMIRKSIPRWAGALLVLTYIGFFSWGFWDMIL